MVKNCSLEIFIISKKITLKFLKISSKSSNLENEANTVSYLTIDGKAVAVFGFKDKIKENAKSAIKFYKIKALKLS
jgi:cation transport ATPase